MTVQDFNAPASSLSRAGKTAFPTRALAFIRKYYIAYIFIAVPVIWNIVFLLVPMVVSLWWSFNDFSGITPPRFIGLANYRELILNDTIFHAALKNTTLFVLLGQGSGPMFGLATALLLNQKVRFQSIFRTAYFLPVMTSLVVVATIWIMLYNRNGLLNNILVWMGLQPIGWLSDPHWALLSIIMASVWQGFGFETVIFLAALQSIPKELYEAATMDGAGAIARFRYVTLPSLRPVIFFVYIIGVIGSYQVFDQVYVMTSGGPVYSTTTLVYHLFSKFRDLRLGYASAIAYILFAILVLFSYIQWRLSRER
ncbi:MAG: carbohydrate ABC transporter permease [Omnitrophica WOR_2 bacterium]